MLSTVCARIDRCASLTSVKASPNGIAPSNLDQVFTLAQAPQHLSSSIFQRLTHRGILSIIPLVKERKLIPFMNVQNHSCKLSCLMSSACYLGNNILA